MSKPGIMIYFDLIEPLKGLPADQRGELMLAMLEYGRDGTVPEFDGTLGLAWGFIRPKLDRDDAAYEETVLQRKYAQFCRKRNKLQLPKIPFVLWQDMTEEERERAVMFVDRETPADIDPYPDTAVAVTPSVTLPINTKTKETLSIAADVAVAPSAGSYEYDPDEEDEEYATATSAKDHEVQFMGGTCGKGVLMLTDKQIDALLELLGFDGFNYYTDKLSTFILERKAKVRNHFETILRWWKEDRQINLPPEYADKLDLDY